MNLDDVRSEMLHASLVDCIFAQTPEFLGDAIPDSSSVIAGELEGAVSRLLVGLSQRERKMLSLGGSREGKPVEDNYRRKRPRLSLKHSGTEVDVAAALVDLRYIRFVANSKERLQQMVDLALGHPERVSKAVLESADTFHLLAEDGLSMKDNYREILLSALEKTSDGDLVLLTNPFTLKTEGDKLIVEREQRRCDRMFRKLHCWSEDIPIDDQELRSTLRKRKPLEKPIREKVMLPLQHGGQVVDVGEALDLLRTCQFLAQTKAERQQLAGLTYAHPERVSKTFLRCAETLGILAEDGISLRDTYRVVLLSALAKTSDDDWLLLDAPFLLETEEDRSAFERERRRNELMYRRELKEFGKHQSPPSGDNEPRSR